MVRRKNEQASAINEKMRGGGGSVELVKLLDPASDELYGKGRLFSRIVLRPGCSIGYHVHENEMEAFFVLSGRPEYSDNGQLTFLSPGDVALTMHGEGHSIGNPADAGCDAEVVALILYK